MEQILSPVSECKTRVIYCGIGDYRYCFCLRQFFITIQIEVPAAAEGSLSFPATNSPRHPAFRQMCNRHHFNFV